MAEPEPIVVVDTWKIREGELDAFKDAAREFVDSVAENEPRLIAYDVYIDEERSHSTVIQIQPDSASTEFHMNSRGRSSAVMNRTGAAVRHPEPALDIDCGVSDAGRS
jgi:quinol monooxygenase YgiN